MLVLSRKLGEKIWLDDNISITVTYLDKGKVRLGIQAPASVNIARDEVRAKQLKPAALPVPSPAR